MSGDLGVLAAYLSLALTAGVFGWVGFSLWREERATTVVCVPERDCPNCISGWDAAWTGFVSPCNDCHGSGHAHETVRD